MIPKVIHYCWFGGKEKPISVRKCIASWEKYCPDYTIIEWNENNTDLDSSLYVAKAYKERKWAYLTDYLRLCIILNQGGIYFDTDVELIKNIDDILNQSYFLGCESKGVINTGLGFGGEKENEVIQSLLEEYDSRFKTGVTEYVACPELNTVAIQRILGDNNEFNSSLGVSPLQVFGGTIYPPEYFCPLNYHTKKLTITDNTYSIHHYDGSWLDSSTKIKSQIRGFLRRTFSKKKWD